MWTLEKRGGAGHGMLTSQAWPFQLARAICSLFGASYALTRGNVARPAGAGGDQYELVINLKIAKALRRFRKKYILQVLQQKRRPQ